MMLSMVLFTNHANAIKIHVDEESDHVSISSDSRRRLCIDLLG